jgi:hypothetical protein
MIRSIRTIEIHCVVIMLLGVPSGWCDETNELLHLVRQRNRESIELIQSYHCEVTSKSLRPNHSSTGNPTYPGQYWRSGNDIRVNLRIDTTFVESVLQNGKIVSLNKLMNGKNRLEFFGRIHPNKPFAIDPYQDVWYRSLFSHYKHEKTGDLGNTTFVFDDLLKDKHYRLVKIEKRKEKEIDYIVADLSCFDTIWQFWFNPKVNYLVEKLLLRKQISESKDQFISIRTVKQFREVSPGIFCPTQSEFQTYLDGELEYIDTFEFNKLSVNQILPNTTFQIVFPPETEVEDRIQGIRYIVGKDGLPKQIKKGLGSFPPSIGKESHSNFRPLPLSNEARSWTRFLVPLSSALLVFALLVRARRKNQSQ